MTLVRAQVSIPMDSGIPADTVTNTFHFEAEGPISGYSGLHTAIEDFYTDVTTSGNALSSFYADTVADVWTVTYYNMDDPIPRVPVYEDTFTRVASSSASTLPTEVALVMSFQATRVAGQKQARRRNRVFLGPFNVSANTALTGRPQFNLQNTVAAAGQALLDWSTSDTSWDWVVNSPTNANYIPVDNGWVDDAWDTQRRRGVAPAARQVFA